jgi:hypothetical protein
MARYRVLFGNALVRAGEVGDELPNDYAEKYAVKLDFGYGPIIEDPGSFLHGVRPRRVVYFYEGEVERMADVV